MSEKEFNPEDPMALTGMVVSLSPEEARRAKEDMAVCFIEEYLMMGYSEEKVLDFFRDPAYRATHAVYKSRGETCVRHLILRVRNGNETQTKSEVSHG